MGDTGSGATAVLLIDLQRDFLEESGRMPVGPQRAADVLHCARQLLGAAERGLLLPVLIVNQFAPSDRIGNFFRRDAAVRGSPGAAIDPRVPFGTGPVLPKEAADAFSNPALEALLGARQVRRVAVMGVFAEGCVRATVSGAIKRGYEVVALVDGIESDAAWKKRFGLWAMRRTGARLTTTGEFLGGVG